LSIKDAISAKAINAEQRETINLPTPFWPEIDGQVRLRMLTAGERIRASGPEEGGFWARCLALAMVDESGATIFTSVDEGADLLMRQRPELVPGLLDAYEVLRAWAFPSAKDAEKNSKTSSTSNSPTDSGSPSENLTSKDQAGSSNESAAVS
jgi:hypothetical protein